MKPYSKKVLKITSLVVLIIIIVMFFCLTWLYSGNLTGSKLSILNKFSLPAALVNYQNIPVSSLELRYNLSQTYFAEQNLPVPPSQGAILNELIYEQKTKQLVSSRGILVTQPEIDKQYNDFASSTSTQPNGNLQNVLNTLGINESVFETNFIEPALLQTDLEVWFNSQKSLNQDAYQLAQTLTTDIQSGQNISSLAQTYSQDKTSGQVSGDLGFIDPIDLLPELRDPVENMKVGSVIVAPSRYGIHVIELQSRDGNQVHLYQIFLSTGNFQAWFTQETNDYKVIRLLNV